MLASAPDCDCGRLRERAPDGDCGRLGESTAALHCERSGAAGAGGAGTGHRLHRGQHRVGVDDRFVKLNQEFCRLLDDGVEDNVGSEGRADLGRHIGGGG